MAVFVNRSGIKYGRLTAIKRVGTSVDGSAAWLCKCDCGNERIVPAGHLNSGHTKSCGCVREEKAKTAPLNDLYAKYRYGAKKRNLSFDISIEEFNKLTKGNCFYCGKEPSYSIGGRVGGPHYIYNGIDRLYSDKGYVDGNMVTCCKKCNQAKSNQSKEEFIEWISRVYNNLKL